MSFDVKRHHTAPRACSRPPGAPQQNVIADTLAALAFRPFPAPYAPAAALRQRGVALFNTMLSSQPRDMWLGLGLGTLIAWTIAASVLVARL